LVSIPKWLADAGLKINRLYYKQLLHSRYKSVNDSPSWFDHRIDLFYFWPQNLFWLERGILPRQYMFPSCTVLDLFCGDGFFSRYFYSTIAAKVDAIDKNLSAIEHARRLHSTPRVNYCVLDAVTQDFPDSKYDVVVWFEGIEHLSQSEYRSVIERVKRAIGLNGVLIGSTPMLEEEQRGKTNWEHQNEFLSLDHLRSFLSEDFFSIEIHTTTYPCFDTPNRTTAYFTLRKPK